MEYRHTFKFSNGGRPFEITVEENAYRRTLSFYDGNLHTFDDDCISVELIEQKGLIFKKYSLLVKYHFGSSFDKSISSKTIPLTLSEISTAKQACYEANNMIKYIKDKKEQYSKEQDRKLAEARANDTIEVIGLDGKKQKIWRRETFFGDTVLFAEGGNAYHTHADCFESWKPMYKRQFKMWQLMKKSDAENQGLCECKLCEKYYDVDDDDDFDDLI